MAKANSIRHYPVDNGDMTLIQVGSKGVGKTILVDMKIRDNNDKEQSQYDVASDLYNHLPVNSNGSPYVDLFILTHPDKDHCLGYEKYMFSDKPDSWKNPKDGEPKKIIMNEIWFSEVCTKRASEKKPLYADAKAFRTEAKRRRNLFEKKEPGYCSDGNRLKVIGMDKDDSDKSESWNLDGIVISKGEQVKVGDAKALILAPLDDDVFDEDNEQDKNNSSIVIRWTINSAHLLLGGDASVHIWKNIWEENKKDTGNLKYDLLVAPHHCSWRTLSYDSASKTENPKVCTEAKNALAQTHRGAFIVSSSKKVKAKEKDPPSYLAKNEYVDILGGEKERFICLADSGTDKKNPTPQEFTLSVSGAALAAVSTSATSSIPNQDKPVRHG